MIPLDEATALAIVFANTRRQKRTTDIVTVAEALDFLVETYGSQTETARKIGLSSEMIREFRKVLTLPPKVLDMIRSREIDKIDVAYRISKIKDPGEQLAAVKQAVGSLTDDVRAAGRAVSQHGGSFKEAKEKVAQAKLRDLHVFVIEVDDGQEKAILREARKKRKQPAELVKQIVLDWLKTQMPTTRKKR